MKFRGTYCNAQYWYLRLFSFTFLDIYFANVMVPLLGSAGEEPKPPAQTPPPFVMTQINEIKARHEIEARKFSMYFQ